MNECKFCGTKGDAHTVEQCRDMLFLQRNAWRDRHLGVHDGIISAVVHGFPEELPELTEEYEDDGRTCTDGEPCEITADIEYDPTGHTFNCERCGRSADE